MTFAHVALGLAVVALFAVAALLGTWAWYRSASGRAFWVVLRAGQAALVVQALLGGALLLSGRRAADLHLVYGLLGLGISFAAEQLRVSAAETVLAARGHESARAVGRLPAAEQRSVVMAIVRREVGVMAVAAAVIVVLALRAWTS